MSKNTAGMKKISNLHCDYMSIDTVSDLQKRKLTMVDYRVIPEIAIQLQKTGKAETFITNVAKYFEKFNFKVTLADVNYVIEM